MYGYIYKLELLQDLETFKKGECYIGKHNGIKQEYFGNCCKNISKTSYNYIWKYKES